MSLLRPATTRPLRRAALAATTTALAFALAACGQGTAQNEESSPADASTPAASGESGDGFTVAGALADLPAAAAGGTVSVADVAAVAAANDADLQGADALADLVRITGGPGEPAADPVMVPPSTLVPSAGRDTASLAGFTLADVVWFADAENPPGSLTVVHGPFDAKTLPAALLPLEDGIVTDADAPDFQLDIMHMQDRLNTTGAPTRFATGDGVIAFGSSTPLVRDWLAAGETLADDPAWSEVAAALDGEQAVSAAFSSTARPEGQLNTAPFDLVGIGWRAGATLVAYHFASADDAKASVDALRTAWSDGTTGAGSPVADLFSVTSVEADGAVVLATLGLADGGRAFNAYQMLMQADPLVTPTK